MLGIHTYSIKNGSESKNKVDQCLPVTAQNVNYSLCPKYLKYVPVDRTGRSVDIFKKAIYLKELSRKFGMTQH